MKLINFLIFFSLSLSADIKFKGSCMGYYIDVDFQSSDYKDLYCYPNELLSWNVNKKRYYRVIPISGDIYTGLSFQEIDTKGRYKEVLWKPLTKDEIKFIKNDYVFVLLGLITGFTVMFISSLFLGNI
jgi:hypothetical protein